MLSETSHCVFVCVCVCMSDEQRERLSNIFFSFQFMILFLICCLNQVVLGSGAFLNQLLCWVPYIPFAKKKSFLLTYKLVHSLVWKYGFIGPRAAYARILFSFSSKQRNNCGLHVVIVTSICQTG